jgi:hypothetical protein
MCTKFSTKFSTRTCTRVLNLVGSNPTAACIFWTLTRCFLPGVAESAGWRQGPPTPFLDKLYIKILIYQVPDIGTITGQFTSSDTAPKFSTDPFTSNRVRKCLAKFTGEGRQKGLFAS